MPNNDKYNLTLEEVSKRLNKSNKTISRYIKKGLLSPIQDLSDKGTLVYRFSEEDITNFKGGQTRQDRTKGEDKTGHSKNADSAKNLHNAKTRQDTDKTSEDKNSTDKILDILTAQLEAKDRQIENQQGTINGLTERLREAQINLNVLSQKIPMLTEGKTRQDIEGQNIVTEDKTESTDRPDTTTIEVKPEADKEAKTDQTDQTGQPKKKGFFSRLFGLDKD